MRLQLTGLLVAMLATGCTTYSLEELRHTEPSGSAFNQMLAKRYLDFAEGEAKAYDWMDSARFAGKGLLAAYDNEVGPEQVSDYALSEEDKTEAEAARAELLSLLNDKNRAERPEVAAEALFYFDCWLEQQEEGWEKDDISYCQDRFKDRIAELKDLSFEEVLREQGEMAPAVDTTSYVVFFDWGQAVITDEGAKVIDEVVQELEPQEDYEVILNGHTDSSGNSKYNLQLSTKRAEAVKARLITGGVAEDAIKIFAYGETDQAAATKDGVQEKANRRVEIFLGE